MLEHLRFRWGLWRIERARQNTSAAYDKDIAEAKKRGDKQDEIYDLENVANHEDNTYAEEIYRLHTRYLWREANRLIVPTPASDDKKAWEDVWGHRHLTHKGINDLRAAIRVEKKLRREQFLMWLPAVVALIGLAGALTGLISVWLK
jgi:hypothetical protein